MPSWIVLQEEMMHSSVGRTCLSKNRRTTSREIAPFARRPQRWRMMLAVESDTITPFFTLPVIPIRNASVIGFEMNDFSLVSLQALSPQMPRTDERDSLAFSENAEKAMTWLFPVWIYSLDTYSNNCSTFVVYWWALEFALAQCTESL